MQITSCDTPCLVYNISQLRKNLEFYKVHLPNKCKIVYATMANDRKEILEFLYQSNIGFFVNSISHLELLQEHQFDESQIIFAASGNDLEEMHKINSSTAKFYIDSVKQFELFQRIGSPKKIGIRLNISSLIDFELEVPFFSRIGIEKNEAISLLEKHSDTIDSLHIYCGTNITSSSLYLLCIQKAFEIAKAFHNIKSIDIGGGFPLISSPYSKEILTDIKAAWEKNISGHEIDLIIEPGRALVDNTASFYVKVNDIKYLNGRCIVLVNSSYTCYPRKVLHRSNEQAVFILGKEELAEKIEVSICGNTTFSNDILTTCFLPEAEIGDVICFKNAGAYIENSYVSYLGAKKPTVIIN